MLVPIIPHLTKELEQICLRGYFHTTPVRDLGSYGFLQCLYYFIVIMFLQIPEYLIAICTNKHITEEIHHMLCNCKNIKDAPAFRGTHHRILLLKRKNYKLSFTKQKTQFMTQL